MYFDPERIYMHQYSLEDQIKIIDLGRKKIRKWTGEYPTAHRAGGYGINSHTLIALKKNNILTDCSFYFGNRRCQLDHSLTNIPFISGEVLEVPITLYKKASYFCLPLRFRTLSYEKLDYRYGSSVKDIKCVIKKSDRGSVLVVFLHSFNFLNIKHDNKSNKIKDVKIDYKMIDKFKSLIEWISMQDDCEFSNFDEIKPSKIDDGLVTCKKINIFNFLKRLTNNV
jgi:hypothetical protein